jgi:predicted dehydrogenase
MVDTGLLGELSIVNTVYHGQPPKSDWYYDPDSAGGGVVSDFGPHIFDIYLDLFDQPLDIDSSTVTEESSDVETRAEIQLRAGDASITTSLRWTRKAPFHQMTLVGSEGVLRLGQQSIKGRVQGEEIDIRGGALPTVDIPSIYKSWFGSEGETKHSRFDDFIDNVLRGDPETTVPVSRAVDVGSLKEHIYEAANDA